MGVRAAAAASAVVVAVYASQKEGSNEKSSLIHIFDYVNPTVLGKTFFTQNTHNYSFVHFAHAKLYMLSVKIRHFS